MRAIAASFMVAIFLYAMPVLADETADEITTLSAYDAQKRVAQADGKHLLITGVAAPSPDVAAELAKHSGSISLADINGDLSSEAAVALAQHKGGSLSISFRRRQQLTTDACQALSQYRGKLALDVASLSPDGVRMLSSHKGTLELSRNPSAREVRILRRHRAMDGPVDAALLTPDVAKALAAYEGSQIDLRFYQDLYTFTADVAAALSSYRGELHLSWLDTLTPEAAAALSQLKGDLYLDDLNEIPPDIAEGLAKHSGKHLSLKGLRSDVSPESAAALSHHKGELRLRMQRVPSDDVITALAQHKGGLDLPGLGKLTTKAARQFGEHEGALSIPDLGTLTKPLAVALARNRGDLSLAGVKALAEGEAEGLASHFGILSLYGVSSLRDEAAAALAKHRGGLRLLGLRVIKLDQVKALAANNTLMLCGRNVNQAVKALLQAVPGVQLLDEGQCRP